MLNFTLNASLFHYAIGSVPRFNGNWNANAIFTIFAPKLMRTFALPVKAITILFEDFDYFLIDATHAALRWVLNCSVVCLW